MLDLEFALGQIRTARLYTKNMLQSIGDGDWYRQPSEGVTHIAWQVGHLAVCEYALALKRMRGERTGDEELISMEFRKLFGKGSVPSSEMSVYPSPREIRDVLDRVHQRALDEVVDLPSEVLSQSAGEPEHPMFKTKFEALGFCAQHEFIHAGQIGLLRRLLGAQPIR
jgi:uncharacterized damage-inducible protein DinB